MVIQAPRGLCLVSEALPVQFGQFTLLHPGLPQSGCWQQALLLAPCGCQALFLRTLLRVFPHLKNLGFNSRSASYWEMLCKLLTLKPQFQRFEITVKMNRGLCTCHAAVNACCLLFVVLTAFSASTEHNPVGSLSAHHHEIQQHNRILLTSCPPSSCYYSCLCDTVGGLKLRSIRKTTAWMNPFPGKDSSAEKTVPSSKT